MLSAGGLDQDTKLETSSSATKVISKILNLLSLTPN